jgi:hypothetical protein
MLSKARQGGGSQNITLVTGHLVEGEGASEDVVVRLILDPSIANFSLERLQHSDGCLGAEKHKNRRGIRGVCQNSCSQPNSVTKSAAIKRLFGICPKLTRRVLAG